MIIWHHFKVCVALYTFEIIVKLVNNNSRTSILRTARLDCCETMQAIQNVTGTEGQIPGPSQPFRDTWQLWKHIIRVLATVLCLWQQAAGDVPIYVDYYAFDA